MIWASYEAKRFSLDTFGASEKEARDLLARAFYRQEALGECVGDPLVMEDIEIRTVDLGTVLLDGEEYSAHRTLEEWRATRRHVASLGDVYGFGFENEPGWVYGAAGNEGYISQSEDGEPWLELIQETHFGSLEDLEEILYEFMAKENGWDR